MSTTKQTKELLDQVRRRLDKESRAAVEPILRSILDVAKPKTVTQVAYRHDPADEVQIDSLRAALVSKDEEIRKLRFKLASTQKELDRTIASSDDELQRLRSTLARRHNREVKVLRETIVSKEEQIRKLPARLASLEKPPWPDGASVDELLMAVDKIANKYMQCIIKSMYVTRGNAADVERKKEILLRSVVLGNVVLVSYLNALESCDKIDGKKLKRIVDDRSIEALQTIARDIHALAGIDIDLKLKLGSGNSGANGKPRRA
jgi:hypothetical protein